MQSKHPTTREVIANPGDHAHEPERFRAAWSIELALKGRSFCERRVGAPAHLIAPAAPTPLAERIRAHAARIGRTGPTPLICPGARV